MSTLVKTPVKHMRLQGGTQTLFTQPSLPALVWRAFGGMGGRGDREGSGGKEKPPITCQQEPPLKAQVVVREPVRRLPLVCWICTTCCSGWTDARAKSYQVPLLWHCPCTSPG